jgi:hypothetical protein
MAAVVSLEAQHRDPASFIQRPKSIEIRQPVTCRQQSARTTLPGSTSRPGDLRRIAGSDHTRSLRSLCGDQHPAPRPKDFSRSRALLILSFPAIWLVVLAIGSNHLFDSLALAFQTLAVTAFAVWCLYHGYLILSGRLERNWARHVATVSRRLLVLTCVSGVMTLAYASFAATEGGATTAGLIAVLMGVSTVGFARAWWQARGRDQVV